MPNDLVSQLRELANTTNRGVTNQQDQNTEAGKSKPADDDGVVDADYEEVKKD